jgi:hypothetical protein
MTIRYKCEQCGSVLKIKDALAGTDGRCPKCKTAFVVPAATPAETVETQHDPESEVDFDPVAFLMDDGGKPRKTPAPAAEPTPPPRAATSRRAAAAEPEPDVAEPAPRRRSALSRTDGGSASQTADEMLRVNASANAKDLLTKTMEESRVRAAQMPEERGEPAIDWKQEFRDLLVRFGPAVGGVVLLLVLAYAFAHYMAGGGLELPDLGRVSGVVTKGGKPLPGALVTFEPFEPSKSLGDRIPGGASALTNEDGEYDLKYLEDVRGAAVGKNRVWVSLIGPDGREVVPPQSKFGYGSTDVFDVKPGSNEFNIEIP